jgi:hypothetical protein
MLNRLADPVKIIDTDIADTGTRRSHVHENQRYLTQFQIIRRSSMRRTEDSMRSGSCAVEVIRIS